MSARRFALATLLLGALLYLAIGVVPALWALSDALSSPREALQALLAPLLWRRLGTTLLLAAGVLALSIPLGLSVAWLLTRTEMPLRGLFLLAAPFPFFLPPLVHVLTWFSWLRLEGIPAIILVYTVSFTPLVLLFSADALGKTGRERSDTIRLLGGRWRAVADELLQALPSALFGGSIALVFILSDFAVADFLTAVGPGVTVYADTLYAHHLGGRKSAAAAAAIPGMLVCFGALLLALSLSRRTAGTFRDTELPAPPWRLGPWKYPAALFATAVIGAGSLLPLLILAHRTGSWEVFSGQLQGAWPRITFSLRVGLAASGLMVLTALCLASQRGITGGRRLLIDVLVFLPMVVPPLTLGIGLIRTWNRPILGHVYLGEGIVVLALAGRYLPFAWLMIRSGADRLDRSIFDAARMCGAGYWRRTVHLTARLLAPSLLAAWCVGMGLTFRELDTLIMLRAGQQSLPFHLYANIIFSRDEEVAALALILALVTYLPLAAYLALFRRWTRWK